MQHNIKDWRKLSVIFNNRIKYFDNNSCGGMEKRSEFLNSSEDHIWKLKSNLKSTENVITRAKINGDINRYWQWTYFCVSIEVRDKN